MGVPAPARFCAFYFCSVKLLHFETVPLEKEAFFSLNYQQRSPVVVHIMLLFSLRIFLLLWSVSSFQYGPSRHFNRKYVSHLYQSKPVINYKSERLRSYFEDLELFVLVGASDDRSKLGNKVLRCMLTHKKSCIVLSKSLPEVEGAPTVAATLYYRHTLLATASSNTRPFFEHSLLIESQVPGLASYSISTASLHPLTHSSYSNMDTLLLIESNDYRFLVCQL